MATTIEAALRAGANALRLQALRQELLGTMPGREKARAMREHAHMLEALALVREAHRNEERTG